MLIVSINFRKIHFRSCHWLQNYFCNENFQIYSKWNLVQKKALHKTQQSFLTTYITCLNHFQGMRTCSPLQYSLLKHSHYFATIMFFNHYTIAIIKPKMNFTWLHILTNYCHSTVISHTCTYIQLFYKHNHQWAPNIKMTWSYSPSVSYLHMSRLLLYW